MKKLNSGVSYNSGTSSETSETQSVEENQQSDSVTASGTNTPSSRIPKSWKRMKDSGNEKDAESKRPPWRAVSISTLPKPDKNALLRAKLLDASRRLRATKTAVGVQTDNVPTKLMKEVSLGAQTDLILFKEVDILTYSVPLMTDTIETATAATQTLIPRLPGMAFLEACTKGTDFYDSNLLQQCTVSERKILKQLSKIRKTIVPLTAKFEENFKGQQALDYDSNTDTDTDTTSDTIKSIGSKTSTNEKDSLAFTTYRSGLLKPTQLSWYFEYDSELTCENKFHPYTITANKPWHSFTPLAAESTFFQYPNNDLNLLLKAIDDLIMVSNRLADQIEAMTRKRSQKQQRHSVCKGVHVKEFVPIDYTPPSEYWLPIIEEQEKVLAELKSFKGTDIKKYEEYIEKLE
ncbi:hypothetical protein DOY81_005117 [Sarcophaga bullata]|nr:hypothetical protein DOY81_005117 [Sarcophaga bullata]